MKKLQVLLATIAALAGSTISSANGVVFNSSVTEIGSFGSQGDLLFIQVSGTVVNPAPCSTSTTWQYALSLTTAQGQQLLAMIMTAKATGSATMSFTGNGTCNVIAGVETLDGLTF
jgi:hypothetical protein